MLMNLLVGLEVLLLSLFIIIFIQNNIFNYQNYLFKIIEAELNYK